jgi:hypothetical protein
VARRHLDLAPRPCQPLHRRRDWACRSSRCGPVRSSCGDLPRQYDRAMPWQCPSLPRCGVILLLAVFAGAVLVATVSGPAFSAGTGSYVACHVYTGGNVNDELLARPQRCAFAVYHGTPGGILVRGMHWHGWGAAVTTTSGTYVGNMNYRARTHVRLYRRRPCTGYGHVYTRMRMQDNGSPAATIKLQECG